MAESFLKRVKMIENKSTSAEVMLVANEDLAIPQIVCRELCYAVAALDFKCWVCCA